jgi:hypothetical protein
MKTSATFYPLLFYLDKNDHETASSPVRFILPAFKDKCIFFGGGPVGLISSYLGLPSEFHHPEEQLNSFCCQNIKFNNIYA